MHLWSAWARPEYRYRPLQIFKRVLRQHRRPRHALVRLPWGLSLKLNPQDDIGRHLWLRGVFDLPVTEVLWRLAGPGSITADVGANIGYMTSVLAARGATVHAFEPSPSVCEELRKNVARWPGAQVTVHQKALSNREGRLHLSIPPENGANSGLAAIGEAGVEVAASTLDAALGNIDEVRVVKLDVEGHEAHVLRGCEALLRARKIRHLVFEEHRPVPSPATELLTREGYAVFSISYDVRGLSLEPMGKPNLPLPGYESPSYLGTSQLDQALALLRPAGWHSLRGRP